MCHFCYRQIFNTFLSDTWGTRTLETFLHCRAMMVEPAPIKCLEFPPDYVAKRGSSAWVCTRKVQCGLVPFHAFSQDLSHILSCLLVLQHRNAGGAYLRFGVHRLCTSAISFSWTDLQKQQIASTELSLHGRNQVQKRKFKSSSQQDPRYTTCLGRTAVDLSTS